MIDATALERQLAEEVPAQRWFGAKAVTGIDRLTELDGKLYQVVLRADDGSRYQTVVGMCDDGSIVDATADHDLSLALFGIVLPGQAATKVRPLGAEQSNTSLVFDERLVLKLFRRLNDGPNPDVEVTRALAAIGFEHVIAPVGLWRDDDHDYAVANDLLVSSADGWNLAITSLRDLYDRRCAPEDAPGDFGFESERLGAVTAQLHVAMADAFPAERADVDGWIADMEGQLARADLPAAVAKRARARYVELREVDPGPAVRIHGDFHLGQTLRTDQGWFLLDFEGEPARPIEERRRPSSPLRDVAGMLRSFHYAAQVALREANGVENAELAALADAWERHNAARFLAGYGGGADVDRVLPPPAGREVVLRAFELDKAVYEVTYEHGHRPDWEVIPLSAVTRLTEA